MAISTYKNKKASHGIVAIFKYLDDVTQAMEKIKHDKLFADHELFSPTSYHELIEFAEEKYGPSQVRWFTCIGALTGVMTGFGLPLLCDYDWPIVVGGKTAGVYSLPAYVIFGFELMILFGAIATIAGMLWMGRLPNPKGKVYDVRTTDDRFAIFVPEAVLESEQAKILQECGAEEIFVTH